MSSSGKNLGLSGDSVSIIDRHVIKTCLTNQERFLANIEKQKKFNNKFIKPVEITESGTIDNKNYIKMPYYHNNNSIIYLSTLHINNIKSIIDKISNYINETINNSEIKEFDYNPWIIKINELSDKITDKDILNILNNLKNIKFNNKFYFGSNHGDMTFSNLLLSENNEIYAIDFLSSFIESPINDIVKLRQDTNHLWSITLTNGDMNLFDKNKVILILKYFDKTLLNIINSNKILFEYYLSFQILNLIRILPYCKDENISIYLKNEIKELYNKNF